MKAEGEKLLAQAGSAAVKVGEAKVAQIDGVWLGEDGDDD
jgi:hypothetical protein